MGKARNFYLKNGCVNGTFAKRLLSVVLSAVFLFSSVCVGNASSEEGFLPFRITASQGDDFQVDVDFKNVGDKVTGVNIRAYYDTSVLKCTGVEYGDKVLNQLYMDGVTADKTAYSVAFISISGMTISSDPQDFVTFHFEFVSEECEEVEVEIRCKEYTIESGESIPMSEKGLLMAEYVFSRYCNPDIEGELFLEHIIKNDWIYDEAPTCTTGGTGHKTCSGCGEYISGEVPPLGHDYQVTEAIGYHPHTEKYECSRCHSQKSESPYDPSCIECNYSVTLTENKYVLDSYNGTQKQILIPSEYNGKRIISVGDGCFENNTNILSVEIAKGVSSIGSNAFKGCSSLESITIPYGIKSIGAKAFEGFEGTIYCFSGSVAHTYAENNNIDFVLMGIDGKGDTVIYHDSMYVYTSEELCANIYDLVNEMTDSYVWIYPSHKYGSTELMGTGTVIEVEFRNDYIGEYTLVVNGDTNGDSVCDVLDCVDVQRASVNRGTLEDAKHEAGDLNGDGSVTAEDYQSIVNKAVS